MPTRLLLEGPDIEQLLARVRDEHGAHARIVSAEKVRTGGFGGFFAKQRFELAVEVDDEDLYEEELVASRNGTARVAAEPASVQDLIDLVEAREVGLTSPEGAGLSGTGGAGGLGNGASGLAGNGAVPAAGRSRSKAASSAGAAGRGAAASRAGAAQSGAARRASGGARPAARPAAPARPAAGLPTSGAGSAAGSAAGLTGAAGVSGAGLRPAGGSVPATTARTDPAATTSVAVVPASPAVPGTGVAVGPATVPVLPAAYLNAGLANLPGALARPVTALLALGLPEALALRAVGTDRYTAVLTAVGGLPPAPPPPDAAGEILALVGDVAACTALGEALSELQYLDGTRVLVAGPVPAGTGVPPARRILGPDDAARRAGKLRASDTARVVVVAAPVDGRSGDWARAVLAALRPTATWALIDATRKIHDTARHLADLGELDALAVHSAAVTADPGSLLGLTLDTGLPIGFLDGRPATPEEWAALLCARMSET